MIAFTICSRNFLSYALTLHETFQRHHPDVPFHVALCDSDDDLDAAAFPFTFLRLAELGLPDLEGMAARYSITELNTAIKPFVFQVLFDRFPGEPVLYLDPDIYVVSRFDELFDVIAAGARCVLTPAITEPAEHAEFDDQRFLRYGAYNLGFCCLADDPAVRRVTWWWARRLERMCIEDLPAGLFMDQKWADLFPALIEGTSILRHPGYNVAYWNLPQRRLSRGDQGWSVNGEPLRFLHFSGNSLEDATVFSRHSALLDVRNVGPAAELLAGFRADVARNGYAQYKAIPYAFAWSGSRPTNAHTPEAVNLRQRATGDASPHLPVLRWRQRADYDHWTRLSGSIIDERRAREAADAPLDLVPGQPFTIPGFCAVCQAPRTFRTGSLYALPPQADGRSRPNWREHLACEACHLNDRQRAAFQLLRQEVAPGPEASIYLTEHVTRFYTCVAAVYPTAVGSEFLGADVPAGDVVDGVRHEDLQALSFDDATFDAIVSLDVLEHVPHEARAFEEMARCLRPGGTLLLTAPTRLDRHENEVRAVLRPDGEIEHILEPEYHGNPVDKEAGALCYRYFGWQILDQMRDAGFSETWMLTYWSQRLCYYGEPQSAVLAIR